MKLAASLAAMVVVALTVASALFAGRYSHRWGGTQNMVAAKQQLATMPKEIGSWEVKSSHELSDVVMNLLQCQGYLHRTYQNGDTGDIVDVAVLLGPPGPIAVHTPDICYSSQEYSIKVPRKRVSIPTEEREGQLWNMLFQSTTVDAQLLHVCYGWSDGDTWQAPDDARWPFLGKSHLYKIQTACVASDARGADSDATQEFLREFLPELRRHLVAANAE